MLTSTVSGCCCLHCCARQLAIGLTSAQVAALHGAQLSRQHVHGQALLRPLETSEWPLGIIPVVSVLANIPQQFSGGPQPEPEPCIATCDTEVHMPLLQP